MSYSNLKKNICKKLRECKHVFITEFIEKKKMHWGVEAGAGVVGAGVVGAGVVNTALYSL